MSIAPAAYGRLDLQITAQPYAGAAELPWRYAALAIVHDRHTWETTAFPLRAGGPVWPDDVLTVEPRGRASLVVTAELSRFVEQSPLLLPKSAGGPGLVLKHLVDVALVGGPPAQATIATVAHLARDLTR